MPTLWQCLKTEEEMEYLKGFLPSNWQPPRPVGPPVKLALEGIEPLEEIEELLKIPPKGDAALMGRKG